MLFWVIKCEIENLICRHGERITVYRILTIIIYNGKCIISGLKATNGMIPYLQCVVFNHFIGYINRFIFIFVIVNKFDL